MERTGADVDEFLASLDGPHAETVRAMFEQIDTPDTASPCHVQIEAPLILRGSARIPDGWPTEG